MIISLKVSDSTYEKYAEYNATNPRLAMEQQLERFKDASPKDRQLSIPVKERQELERLLGRQIETPSDLVALITRLVTLSVGGVDIPLSEGQMKRLYGLAQHQGREIKEYTEQQVKRAVVTALGV